MHLSAADCDSTSQWYLSFTLLLLSQPQSSSPIRPMRKTEASERSGLRGVSLLRCYALEAIWQPRIVPALTEWKGVDWKREVWNSRVHLLKMNLEICVCFLPPFLNSGISSCTLMARIKLRGSFWVKLNGIKWYSVELSCFEVIWVKLNLMWGHFGELTKCGTILTGVTSLDLQALHCHPVDLLPLSSCGANKC